MCVEPNPQQMHSHLGRQRLEKKIAENQHEQVQQCEQGVPDINTDQFPERLVAA